VLPTEVNVHSKLPMKVRIRRLPPSGVLEGVDLRPYKFRVGCEYECEPDVANVLILWDCADLAKHPETPAKRRRHRRDR
jgi:hypothetical protein